MSGRTDEHCAIGEIEVSVEPSSGNAGIALVGLANALGIPIEIAVPKGIPEEKKVLLKFLGAKVIEADNALCPLFPSEGTSTYLFY